jgi:UDP-4-amino-4,6-dideoxy-N-acetyl-beta-L-altrosamine N-acetyltransferase
MVGDSGRPTIHSRLYKTRMVKVEAITKHDLAFLCEVRNSCATEYLHDSRLFTLDEVKNWFDKTTPKYFTIWKDNERIGYFRTSSYSELNRNITIGADLHESFRGKGYAFNAYKIFINKLFDEYDLNKISLEVLSTNVVAFGLYKKLGFVTEGIKRQDVLKNGIYVDSIIMSILRIEWKNLKNTLK